MDQHSTAAESPARTSADILGAQRWDQTAKGNGRTYRIFVSQPLLPPPPEGYPVVYLPDANGIFGTAAEQASLRALMGEIKPALIVGIGYPVDSIFEALALRTVDLTLPTPPEKIPPQLPGTGTGGFASFLHFITSELAPQLAGMYPINASDRSLIGFSLGGLFVLQALFDQPEAFGCYVAGSPSIWWNDSAVLADEKSFAAAHTSGSGPRVLITAGGLEQSVDGVAVPPGYTREQFAETVRSGRMIDNARELAGRLAHVASTKDQVQFELFEGETHVGVIPATISRGLGFALRV